MVKKYDSFINEGALIDFNSRFPKMNDYIFPIKGDIYVSYLYDVLKLVLRHTDDIILKNILNDLFRNRLVSFNYIQDDGQDGYNSYFEKTVVTNIEILHNGGAESSDIYFKTKKYDYDQMGAMVDVSARIIVHDYTNVPSIPAPVAPRKRIRWYHNGKLAED